jgi:ATP phosphoribosyltransferase
MSELSWPGPKSGRLRVALPKGRVLPALQALLVGLGFAPEEDLLATRRLIVPIAASRSGLGFDMEALLLKNADVPVYVEHGVADVGVAGTDNLYETGVAVYRPHTFGFGGCDIVLAARVEHGLDDLRRRPLLHVATKYVRFTRAHFARLGWPVEIIPLAGSVELAPVLGLADAIVDLSETGKTLRDNGLHPVQVIGRTTLKLVANQALGKTTAARVERLVVALAAAERAGA